MESTGLPGCLHVSKAVYDALRGSPKYEWSQRVVSPKGKGLMSTFILSAATAAGGSGQGGREEEKSKADQPAAGGGV